ncbi:PspC domain-containing protein [uncultured Lacinutrix sp.]|uniref:PspC domain-containing protein n=1 Tax=uncultured Lacinutrix sp. TaxID=574032 RepID=UPI00261420D6|nr:PspC domain-containing protein [uncultured Lacinutrix sp.]
MNKTVNINLAGIFFHIDEDAYLKLQRYLEAIKRSFTDSQGRSEIIADIEARISELFSERVKHDKQVISTKEVDEVISIMGQPEDYLVDDEIFEDEPKQRQYSKNTSSKKLFRDTDNSYVGGVSAGLGHYFGIDALWIRIIWFLLIFGAGTGIILYILLWIFIPEATTTSEKIQMTGDKVTISNIEKKIRDGFENVGQNLQKTGDKLKESLEHASDSVSDSVKNIDFTKKGNSIKSSSKSFFDTMADVFMMFIKIFAKFIGLILMFAAAIGVISSAIGLIFGSYANNRVHFFNSDLIDVSNASGLPFWLISILTFFTVAIPLFFLFYLGLKILVKNLKSIGNTAKYSLAGLWLISVIGLSIMAIKEGLSQKEEAQVIKTEKIENIKANDTLILSMKSNDYFASRFRRDSGFNIAYDEDGNKVKYSQDIRLIVKSTRDSVAKIRINKMSNGGTYKEAKSFAENISYNYTISGNELQLDNHLIIDKNKKVRSQNIEVTLYLPEGSILFADNNTYYYHRNNSRYYNDILNNGKENHYLKVKNNRLECLDCGDNNNDDDDDDDDFEVKVDVNNDNTKLKINNEGFEAKNENTEVIIDDNGVKAKNKNVNVTIDDNGIEITSEKKKD